MGCGVSAHAWLVIIPAADSCEIKQSVYERKREVFADEFLRSSVLGSPALCPIPHSGLCARVQREWRCSSGRTPVVTPKDSRAGLLTLGW